MFGNLLVALLQLCESLNRQTTISVRRPLGAGNQALLLRCALHGQRCRVKRKSVPTLNRIAGLTHQAKQGV